MSITASFARRLMSFTSDIHEESRKGNINEVVKFIEKGNDINKQDKFGMTPLMFAAHEGHAELARILIEKGANVFHRAMVGSSALHLAADNGHIHIARMLFEKGVDPNVQDDLGRTALHRSCAKGHLDFAKMILSKDNVDIDLITKRGNSSLSLASENGHLHIVKMLVEKGANVNSTADTAGWTPLHRAAGGGGSHLSIARFLLETGADVNSSNSVGSTPLHIAVSEADEEDLRMVELLISYGASLNKRTIDHKKPSDFADTSLVKDFMLKARENYKIPSLTSLSLRATWKYRKQTLPNVSSLPLSLQQMLHTPLDS